MVVAFQDEGRDRLFKQDVGRLKALGCSLGDPRAWTVPVRTQVQEGELGGDRLLYIGLGVDQYRVQPGVWGQRFAKLVESSGAGALGDLEEELWASKA